MFTALPPHEDNHSFTREVSLQTLYAARDWYNRQGKNWKDLNIAQRQKTILAYLEDKVQKLTSTESVTSWWNSLTDEEQDEVLPSGKGKYYEELSENEKDDVFEKYSSGEGQMESEEGRWEGDKPYASRKEQLDKATNDLNLDHAYDDLYTLKDKEKKYKNFLHPIVDQLYSADWQKGQESQVRLKDGRMAVKGGQHPRNPDLYQVTVDGAGYWLPKDQFEEVSEEFTTRTHDVTTDFDKTKGNPYYAFKCKECGKQFFTNYDLLDHWDKEHPNKEFESILSEAFAQEDHRATLIMKMLDEVGISGASKKPYLVNQFHYSPEVADMMIFTWKKSASENIEFFRGADKVSEGDILVAQKGANGVNIFLKDGQEVTRTFKGGDEIREGDRFRVSEDFVEGRKKAVLSKESYAGEYETCDTCNKGKIVPIPTGRGDIEYHCSNHDCSSNKFDLGKEGSFGSGRKGHEPWMKGMEIGAGHKECSRCMVITEANEIGNCSLCGSSY